ncbi:MAG: hypothetical protein EOO73_03790 [Myxococcales bacterium]|nr:MAG: hypothetical protein EOO73_03790 [Myxococcales bacterium]
MSRYTGPRVKVMRALGTDLPGLSRKKIERRPFPPGQHGQARRKQSEYGLRLMEKQKLPLEVREQSRKLPPVQASLSASPSFETPWLAVEADAGRATVLELPEPTSVLFAVNVQRVVELYSQRT